MSLKTWFKEHRSSKKKNKMTSGLYRHLLETGYTTSIERVKLLYSFQGEKFWEILNI